MNSFGFVFKGTDDYFVNSFSISVCLVGSLFHVVVWLVCSEVNWLVNEHDGTFEWVEEAFGGSVRSHRRI